MSHRFNISTAPTPSPSLITAWPDAAAQPATAADPAVLTELRRRGYTLEQHGGFTCMIVRVESIVGVLEVGR